MKVTAVAAGLAFPHAAQAIQVVRRRRRPGTKKWSRETVYAMTSLTATQASPAGLAAIIRSHWMIDVVGRVPVQTAAGTVTADRGPRVGMGGGFLDVAPGDARIEGCGDECMAEGVRPDGLADPGAASDSADDPRCAVPVQPPAITGQEDRPLGPFADGQVDGPGRCAVPAGW
jgi:hypothetical protein